MVTILFASDNVVFVPALIALTSVPLRIRTLLVSAASPMAFRLFCFASRTVERLIPFITNRGEYTVPVKVVPVDGLVGIGSDIITRAVYGHDVVCH